MWTHEGFPGEQCVHNKVFALTQRWQQERTVSPGRLMNTLHMHTVVRARAQLAATWEGGGGATRAKPPIRLETQWNALSVYVCLVSNPSASHTGRLGSPASSDARTL